MSTQFVPKTDLTDGKIWHYMLEGVYGSKKQHYAKRVEKVKVKRKERVSVNKQIYLELL